MKILNADQIRQLDAFTIENEPVSSIGLMERASEVFIRWFAERFDAEAAEIAVFVGPGNNGGDGLAIARLLYYNFYKVKIYWCKISENTSGDFKTNLERLPERNAIAVVELTADSPMPEISADTIVIDAIFGSGLNRSPEGYWKSLIEHLNQLPATRVSVDIPSGLFADRHSKGASIHADFTLSFELPKLAFLFPENQHRVGEWHVQSIGLDGAFIEKCKTQNFLIDRAMARSILKKRRKFDHKGTYGHALLLTGSYGKAGAAVLATRAALRSGAGLVTTHIPKCAYQVLQSCVPEAMLSIDYDEFIISKLPDIKGFKAIGTGCGIDTKILTHKVLSGLIRTAKVPVVFDADALNILSERQDLLPKLPQNSILTPHPKEFERLFGTAENDFKRNELQRKKAQELGVYIILKGAHTCIATPQGNCFFNSTGNPGMATAGSGDVLTGLLTGLLAQGYNPEHTAILGVYLHGLSGDLAVAAAQSQESLVAGDLVEHFGKAFKAIL